MFFFWPVFQWNILFPSGRGLSTDVDDSLLWDLDGCFPTSALINYFLSKSMITAYHFRVQKKIKKGPSLVWVAGERYQYIEIQAYALLFHLCLYDPLPCIHHIYQSILIPLTSSLSWFIHTFYSLISSA